MALTCKHKNISKKKKAHRSPYLITLEFFNDHET